MALNMVVQRFQRLYLNPQEANIWFKFRDESVPAHNVILTKMTPWLNSLFNGTIPSGDEIDMTDSGVSVDAFKEFLRFIYVKTVNLTFENIEEVMDLAKQSLIDEFFAECEEFLIKNIANDTMCFAYELALLYNANRLKKVCEIQIARLAETVLKNESFLKFRYEFLLNILHCDILACSEVDIFNACIVWSQEACKRSGQDPMNMTHLRAQLRDCIYQIRFTSMTRQELAACINSYPNLFTAIELHEIICMCGRHTQFNPKKFNWTTRKTWDDSLLETDEKLQIQRAQQFECNRIKYVDNYVEKFKGFVKRFHGWGCNTNDGRQICKTERTTFSVNNFIYLNGFNCNCNANVEPRLLPAIIKIIHIKNDTGIEVHSQQVTLHFSIQKQDYRFSSYDAYVTLNKSIHIYPLCTYIIDIVFETEPTFDGQRLTIDNQFTNLVIVPNNKPNIPGTEFIFSNDLGIISSLTFKTGH
ncbi:uncharacterized protein LOC116344166 [Contarinia nasturtii]|uniref:uncharacterized protein LOC116344166 n=1 Tax=Contarinia nasturtii TaxID=265458 RepID=UPI0012D4653B|nr:uncharacterized protein LOC116344166 [Contarinia nasturtii]